MFGDSEALCNLIALVILVILVVAAYRYKVNGVVPWKSGMKNHFMDSGGCSSCPMISKNIPIVKA